MERTKGVIENIKQRDKGYSYLIAGKWYSAFGKADHNKGETIDFDFETTDKGFNNIKDFHEAPVNQTQPVLAQNNLSSHIMEQQAFNLAMQKTISDREQMKLPNGVMSFDFWTAFAKNSEDVYKAMLAIKPDLHKHG
jgi:hypothetical protein